MIYFMLLFNIYEPVKLLAASTFRIILYFIFYVTTAIFRLAKNATADDQNGCFLYRDVRRLEFVAAGVHTYTDAVTGNNRSKTVDRLAAINYAAD